MNRRIFVFTLTVTLLAGTAALLSAQNPPEGQDGPRRGYRLPNGENAKMTMGEITEIKGDTLTLKTRDGSSVVKITDKTAYRREGAPAKLADFKVGEMVMAAGEPGPNNSVTAILVATRGRNVTPGLSLGGEFSAADLGKKFIAGEVTKIDGTKITVKRTDGVEQTIEADEDTSFRKARNESITLADIKVGDRVGGRGELKNGVFVPAVLNVGMGGGMGQRMRQNGEQKPAAPDTKPAATDEKPAPKEDKK
jgi:ribosome maturation factor RimP